MSTAAKYIPGFDANNRPQEESDALRAESRKTGRLWEPVLDVECAADDCGRVFVQRSPDQEYCTRHRAQTRMQEAS